MLAAVCALLTLGWWLTWREWRGRAQRLHAEVREVQAAAKDERERYIWAAEVLGAKMLQNDVGLGDGHPFAMRVLAGVAAAALEAERDAHRATGAELRRVEGECAALRDRVVTRDGRGRFRKGWGNE